MRRRLSSWVTPPKALPLLLLRDFAINGVVRLSKSTGEITPPIEALASCPRCRSTRSATVAASSCRWFAPTMPLVSSTQQRWLRSRVCRWTVLPKPCQREQVQWYEAARAVLRLVETPDLSVCSLQRDHWVCLPQEYPTALSTVTDNSGLIIKRSNESLICGVAICMGMNGPVKGRRKTQVVMVDADNADCMVKAWENGPRIYRDCASQVNPGGLVTGCWVQSNWIEGKWIDPKDWCSPRWWMEGRDSGDPLRRSWCLLECLDKWMKKNGKHKDTTPWWPEFRVITTARHRRSGA